MNTLGKTHSTGRLIGETACPGAPNHSTHSTALPVDLTANPQLFGAVLVFRRLGLRHMLNGLLILG